jgi:hypothetical protein
MGRLKLGVMGNIFTGTLEIALKTGRGWAVREFLKVCNW